MARAKYASMQKISTIVRDALSRGATVEIDGLGSFQRSGKLYRFQPCRLPRVFISYAQEDMKKASRIFQALVDAGFEPWMDTKKLLPGQNWARAIRNAMETSDFAVCCFSNNSIHKRGGFQAEMRYALECAARLPLGEIFLMPVRLDACPVPPDVAREMQYVDMFPDWNRGIDRLLASIRLQLKRPKAA